MYQWYGRINLNTAREVTYKTSQQYRPIHEKLLVIFRYKTTNKQRQFIPDAATVNVCVFGLTGYISKISG